MTYQKMSIEDILHDYERLRLSNNRTLQNRKNEIYSRIPRIREIDAENSLSYISAAKMKLNNKSANEISSIKQKNRERTAEKKKLLLENGFLRHANWNNQ